MAHHVVDLLQALGLCLTAEVTPGVKIITAEVD